MQKKKSQLHLHLKILKNLTEESLKNHSPREGNEMMVFFEYKTLLQSVLELMGTYAKFLFLEEVEIMLEILLLLVEKNRHMYWFLMQKGSLQ